MKALLPRFNLGRWGGADITGDGECNGWVATFQWFGLIFELAGGRVR